MDPIYKLTGFSRTTQFLTVSMVFGIAGMVLLIKRFTREDRPIDLASSGALKRGIVLLIVLIFLNSMATSLQAVLDDVSSQHWVLLFSWTFAVMVLQAAIVYTVLSLNQKSWVHVILLAVISTFNFISLYLALSGKFSSVPVIFQLFVVLFILLSYLFLFGLIGKRILSLRNVNIVLALTSLIMLVPIATLVFNAPKNDNELALFADIRFRTMPNIHILEVDSLIPGSLARKHMGLSSLPYERVLDNNGVVVYRNAFSSYPKTKLSLNSLMRLANPNFNHKKNYPYFPGRSNSPVTQIFHSNGYKIWTGFSDTYLGNKGPFVDFYYPGPNQPFLQSTLCELALQNPLKLFGICYLMSLVSESTPHQIWPNQIFDIINRSVGEYATPVFTLHYIFDPIGHTPSDFSRSNQLAYEQYIKFFRTGALKAAELIERLRSLVQNDGEPSIFIVTGDHGPRLSLFMSLDDDKTFVVQDRYGILATILVNETDCSAEQLRYYTPIFATPERILASVIRCLTHDPVRFDSLMKFEEDFNFEDFLYE